MWDQPGRDEDATAGGAAKRAVDVAAALAGLLLLGPLMLILAAIIRATSEGPALYWSQRIGRNNQPFPMPKFRTMRSDTPAVATHLLSQPEHHITRVGALLRKSSLDELPQLFSVLGGHMSLVGPRPALFNQSDLIALRTRSGVHVLTPGLTGWAQINGRDELPIPAKVDLDTYYLTHRSLRFDLLIIVRTFFKLVKREGITH
jgi:O-antigen biosynthesis protein WbqP